jgi:hypothetical protein
MMSSSVVQYNVVFHPTSFGVGEGNRGPKAEVFLPYATLQGALQGRDTPPEPGYIAVKITDHNDQIIRERTAGHHIAAPGSVW